jgi:hypothetical protein
MGDSWADRAWRHCEWKRCRSAADITWQVERPAMAVNSKECTRVQYVEIKRLFPPKSFPVWLAPK